jgi:hypothetical protein
MRLLLGLILGAALTVSAAYIHDTHNAVAAQSGATALQRPLVNWDVVSTKWQALTVRARDEWNRHVG